MIEGHQYVHTWLFSIAPDKLLYCAILEGVRISPHHCTHTILFSLLVCLGGGTGANTCSSLRKSCFPPFKLLQSMYVCTSSLPPLPQMTQSPLPSTTKMQLNTLKFLQCIQPCQQLPHNYYVDGMHIYTSKKIQYNHTLYTY